MTPSESGQKSIEVSPAAKDMVMSSLEREQLTGMKKQILPRRKLAGVEVAVLWSLRVYLVFMVVVVVYKMWFAPH
jgi:hypothetical protein